MRKMCIIKSQYGIKDRIRVFWYEEANNLTDDSDERFAKIFQSEMASNQIVTLPMREIELIRDNMVEFSDDGFLYFREQEKQVV